MFDPLDDIIDLSHVVEIVEGLLDETDNCDFSEATNEEHEAYRFIRAFDEDLRLHNVQESDREIIRAVWDYAQDEPTVIARSYFVQYAQELAEDCGMMPAKSPHMGSVPWPQYCIDWEYAAKELAYDYSAFTYDGREYLIRSV